MINYDKAIEMNPGLGDAYFSRGFAKAKLNDNDGAQEDYKTAIGINPGYAAHFK